MGVVCCSKIKVAGGTDLAGHLQKNNRMKSIHMIYGQKLAHKKEVNGWVV